jgi:hypothetical protein
MAPLVTPLIGKRALTGAWIVEPPRVTPDIAARLNALTSSSQTVRVQIRPTITADAEIASEVRTMAGRLIDQARNEGCVRVVMQRGGLLPGSQRHGGHDIQTFEVGKVYDLSTTAALRLLNADPQRYIFEEVSANGTAHNTPIKTNDDVRLRELEEQVRALAEQLTIATAKQAAASTPKRKLKDALGDAADGQE